MNRSVKKQTGLCLYFFFFCIQHLAAQNLILNGSFENNSAQSSTGILVHAADFDSLISDVFFIQRDLLLIANDGSTCITAKDGNWMIGESNLNVSGIFGFTLSQPLFKDHIYQLTFSDQSCVANFGGSRWIDIGLSNNKESFGDIIAHITTGFDTLWTDQSITFSPSIDKTFLTVKLLEEIMTSEGGLHTDNFSLTELNTGISEVEIDSFQLFPNPVSTEVQIVYHTPPSAKQATLEIFDINGKEIFNVHLQKNQQAITLDLSCYAAGMYLLRLITDDKTLITKKLLKQ
jgi:hypothetical protein